MSRPVLFTLAIRRNDTETDRSGRHVNEDWYAHTIDADGALGPVVFTTATFAALIHQVDGLQQAAERAGHEIPCETGVRVTRTKWPEAW